MSIIGSLTLQVLAKNHPDAKPASEEDWQNLGFHRMVAVALFENDKTYGQVAGMSPRDLIELALQWEGILGYTDSLISLVQETME